MKIVYLHGFGSNSQTNKVSFLREKFPDHEVIAFDIPPDADDAFEIIRKNLDSLGKDIVLVGTSLGGFWANYFSEYYRLPCLIMNPSTQPWYTLKLSHAYNMVMGWNESRAESYFKYAQVSYPHVKRKVLLDLNDELIDYRISRDFFINSSEIIYSIGGYHRYTHFDILEEELRDLINGSTL